MIVAMLSLSFHIVVCTLYTSSVSTCYICVHSHYYLLLNRVSIDIPRRVSSVHLLLLSSAHSRVLSLSVFPNGIFGLSYQRPKLSTIIKSPIDAVPNFWVGMIPKKSGSMIDSLQSMIVFVDDDDDSIRKTMSCHFMPKTTKNWIFPFHAIDYRIIVFVMFINYRIES